MALPDLGTVYVATPQASDWLVILPLALCLLSAAILIMFRSRGPSQPIIANTALVALIALDGALLAKVVVSGPVTMMMGRWLPPFGIAFTVDMTGALFAMTSAIVALAASIFAHADIDANRRHYGFYPLLMMLMAGVTGAFHTGDVFNLYVWFEVLLIASFGLMVLGGERAQLDGAIKYGLLNLVATTLFLIAIGILYASYGTLNMADVARKIPVTPAPLFTLTALFLLAFGMKAAVFPVNFWLPASYHTPRITISALFAGLLTKVGIYALLKTLVMIIPAGRNAVEPVIVVVAIATMLLGALAAIGQQDLRRLLGYLVISGIGIMLAGLAIGSQKAVGAVIFYALHSMLVVSGLYFMAGAIAASAKSFSLNRLSGLNRHKGLAALSLVLVLSASGLPPFSGFWPKALLVREGLITGHPYLVGSILLAGFLTMLAIIRVFLLVFWRESEDGPVLTPLPRAMMIPLSFLILPVIGLGIWPQPLLDLAGMAASGLSDPTTYFQSVFGKGGMQ